MYPSGGLSFNKMNLVKPVHASEILFLHPRSSNLRYFSSNSSSEVYVVLVTSMYFIGIGNVPSRHVQIDFGVQRDDDK